MEQLPNYTEANTALNAHLSSRAKDLRLLERFVEGTQYHGLPDFFSDTKPLWERAPCIVYPIVKMAIDSNRDLLLGEGRWPNFTVHGLEGEEADRFEKATAMAVTLGRLKAAAWEAFSAAQACGSACSVFSIVGGRLAIKSVYARWCAPVFDEEGAVESLEIKYPYLEVVTDGDIEKVVCKLYRRTIDKTHDTVYHTITVLESDARRPQKWVADVEVLHGFGFCPVIYYAHLRSCTVVDEFDGHAIHEHVLDEIRAHDFTLSQRHRAAMYLGDPQIVEIGVKKGSDPSGGSGRKPVVPSLFGDGIPAEGGGMYVGTIGSGFSAGPARKKSPGSVWQYDVPDASKVKVSILALPGDALKPIDDHARDLKGKLAEALGVVMLDAASLPNESRLSGKAITDLKAPQLARVDSFRHDFGDHYLIPAIGMLLRISIEKGIEIDEIETVRSAATKNKTWSWHAPPIVPEWGEYFKATAEEEQALFLGTLSIVGVLLTKRKAVEKLKHVLGVKDVDAYMKELEAETAENEAKDLVKLEAEAKATAAAKPQPAPSAKAT